MPTSQTSKISVNPSPSLALRIYSKSLSFLTLFLIFVGGMVTSTESGLSVPDWPLSYGSLFPPMIGGVFYEHGHRMVASFVGLCVVILAIWLHLKEKRRWVKILGFCALGTVIAQGILGGLTVLLMLPPAVSVSHAVLAQIFFTLTIVIAYSLSFECEGRVKNPYTVPKNLKKWGWIVAVLIYIQLIIGAIMRHTDAGLAILDFPTMGGSLWPHFDQAMLNQINVDRFNLDMDSVKPFQIMIHFIHRLGALFIFLSVCILNVIALRYKYINSTIRTTVLLLNTLILTQIVLGILTILTLKAPVLTSFHVATGAASLGIAVLFILRIIPISLQKTHSS